MTIRLAARSGFQGAARSLVLAATCACLPAWASDNLVDNASFESGLSGWLSSGDVGWISGSAADGLASAVLATADAALTWTLATAVDVSQITDFSLAVQNDGGALNLVVLGYADGSSSGTEVMLFDLGNADWTRYSLTDQLAAGQQLLSFTLYGSSGGATLLDAVRLATVSSVPEPGRAVLLAGGALLLGALGRRRSRA
ncbi:PEP-CTERM sorting domain-containing protein [Aquabacterium sp. OR-4]|uniref:PEP-CTERM sorting domain-containing protein n=1 Tax=Aquabacterium sp. OR-4 TaxID=2978127 RepID=UPI0028C75D43|nr:PEP-CTERM sorting domain-containing protein [Aquabacterium sp. OR-4]MDT7836232.1 PEP-CTERM sorting domain-containing protein [Aquabacterium sp. OR-4]